MKQRNLHYRALSVVFIFFAVAFGVSLGIFRSLAFTGPTSPAGVGSGAIATDASYNVAIGTSTTQTGTKLFVIGATADSTTYGFQIWNSNQSPLFTVRDDGSVGIGTTSPIYKLDINGAEARIWNQGTGEARLHIYNNGSVAEWLLGESSGSDSTFTINKLVAGTESNYFTIGTGGYVGIGTTAPAYKLDVSGTGNFTGVVNVGTPVAASNAATKSYVDTAVAGGSSSGDFATLTVTGTSTLSGNWTLSGAAQGDLNMNGYNITSVNKLTVTTVDPVYDIGGVQYATYGPESTGIVVTSDGKGELSNRTNKTNMTNKSYTYAIDFGDAAKGSDLWLFWQTIDQGQGMKNITLTLTPEGTAAELWYDLASAKNEIIVHGDHPVVFSYHLSAPRYDNSKWGNIFTGSGETGTVLKEK